MNDESVCNLEARSLLQHEDGDANGTAQAPPMLGALDIVEAFTALRHELKLQVRGGRELQQSIGESLRRIEERMPSRAEIQRTSHRTDDGRELALAVAEMEESLHRAMETLARQNPAASARASLLGSFDQNVSRASWIAKKFAGRLLNDLRSIVESLDVESKKCREAFELTHRGLELLLARVHRLMQQCEIERVDVLRQAFDAETMHAIDVIESAGVPSSHVAEQLRPAYFWRGGVLRCADVRLAR